jgi:signal transduction histidine kinase
MTPLDVGLWPREIRRYTVLLILLVALFGLVTTGYVLLEKKRTEGLRLYIDGFHLASAFHCTAASEETRQIQAYVLDSAARDAAGEDASGLTPNPDFNLVVSLHLVGDRIEAMRRLQARFADLRTAFLTEKMAKAFDGIEREAATFQANRDVSLRITDDLEALMTSLNQLERLHVISYEELTAQHERQKNRGVIALFAFVLAVTLVGFLCVRKGLRAIEDIIAQQWSAEEKLREAKAEAETANAAKSEFLASMSHELRTPLNSVLGFSQILGSPQFSQVAEKRRMEYAQNIQKSGEHLLALVEDILDLSKIEAGEGRLVETEFDLDDVFNDANRMVQSLAKNKSVTIYFNRNTQSPKIFADKRRVTQIVVNLLSNAVKFNNTNGLVWVTASVNTGGALTIAVRDTGIGIPARDVRKVFEPFRQMRSSSHLAHEGTGLGLALSRKLAELHEGTIELESEVGVGTTVTVLFPRERVIHRVDAPSDDQLSKAEG